METKHSKYEEEAKYSVPVVQDIVKHMQLPKSIKLKATMYFARKRNGGQRIAFVHFDETKRYDYIELIMEEFGSGIPRVCVYVDKELEEKAEECLSIPAEIGLVSICFVIFKIQFLC